MPRTKRGNFILIITLLFLLASVAVVKVTLKKPSELKIHNQVAGTGKISTAYKCDHSIDSQTLRSQSKEDEVLLSYFPSLCGGTYIEFGALTGSKYSNSHVFRFSLNWKGVLIELSPTNFKELQRYRTDEIAVVNAGICNMEQTLHFVDGGPVGGIWEFMTPTFRSIWWKNTTLADTQEFQCYRLQQILDKHAPTIKYYDFMSVDVEGAEFQAIQSVDFEKVSFGIIFLERSDSRVKNAFIQTYLKSKGYIFVETNARSDWFLNEQFHQIYGDLVWNPYFYMEQWQFGEKIEISEILFIICTEVITLNLATAFEFCWSFFWCWLLSYSLI